MGVYCKCCVHSAIAFCWLWKRWPSCRICAMIPVDLLRPSHTHKTLCENIMMFSLHMTRKCCDDVEACKKNMDLNCDHKLDWTVLEVVNIFSNTAGLGLGFPFDKLRIFAKKEKKLSTNSSYEMQHSGFLKRKDI